MEPHIGGGQIVLSGGSAPVTVQARGGFTLGGSRSPNQPPLTVSGGIILSGGTPSLN